MLKEVHKLETVTIAVRLIAILFLAQILASVTHEFFLAFTWKFNPYGEIPNAWYQMTTEWRYTWSDEIAQAFIALILWVTSRPIAKRIFLETSPNACPQCSYPKKNLHTDLCPECNCLWKTTNPLMNKLTPHNSELFLIVASGIRLLAVYFFALVLIHLGQTFVASIGSNFAIKETTENLWWHFSNFRDGFEFSVWAYTIPKFTMAITLWLFNKHITRFIIP